ncbi:MAG: pre-peptidase C-terminal domain-containing protein [Bacillota bacterium]
MYCGFCGTANTEHNLYCIQCGRPMEDLTAATADPLPPLAERFCTACGAGAHPEDLYCSKCGFALPVAPTVKAGPGAGAVAAAGALLTRAARAAATAPAGVPMGVPRAGTGVRLAGAPGGSAILEGLRSVLGPFARHSFREPAIGAATAVGVGLFISLVISALVRSWLDRSLGLSGMGIPLPAANFLSVHILSHLVGLNIKATASFFGYQLPTMEAGVRIGILALLLVPMVSIAVGTAAFARVFRTRTGLGRVAYAVRFACAYAVFIFVIGLIASAIASSGLGEQGVEGSVLFSIPGLLMMGLLLGLVFSLIGSSLRRDEPDAASPAVPYLSAAAAGMTAVALQLLLLAVPAAVLAAKLMGIDRVDAGFLLVIPNLALYLMAYLHGAPVSLSADAAGFGTSDSISASLLGGIRGAGPVAAEGRWISFLLVLIPVAVLVLMGRQLARGRERGDILPASLAFGVGYTFLGTFLTFASQVRMQLGGMEDFFGSGGMGMAAGASALLMFVLLAVFGTLLAWVGAWWGPTAAGGMVGGGLAIGAPAGRARAAGRPAGAAVAPPRAVRAGAGAWVLRNRRVLWAIAAVVAVAGIAVGVVLVVPKLMGPPTLSLDQPETGTLSERTQANWYRFRADQGVTYFVETYNLSPGCDTVVAIYQSRDDEASSLVSNDDAEGPFGGKSSQACWTASFTGMAYVKVTPYEPDRTGTYDIVVSAPPEGGGSSSDAAARLEVGGPGLLGRVGSGASDWFSFHATAGVAHYVLIECLSGDTVAYLLSESSTRIDVDDDSGVRNGSMLTYVPETSENLLVKVVQFPGRTGETWYRIRVLTKDSPLGAFLPDAPRIQKLTLGQPTSGSLASGANWFRFDAQSGNLYVVETMNLSSGCDTVLKLHDRSRPDDDSSLASNDDFFNRESRVFWRANYTGVVYVEVSGYGGGGGTFQVMASAPPGGGGQSRSAASSVAVNGAGMIGSIGSGESDWFKFQAQAGTTYHVIIDLIQGDTCIYVYEPGSGSYFDWDDDSGAGLGSYLSFTASQSGEYSVQVSNHRYHSGGSQYRIRIQTRGPRA